VVLTAALLAGPVAGHRSMGDLEWIRSSLGPFIAAAIGLLVLRRQYALRRSANTALLALGLTVAGMILYLAFPQSLAFAIQSRVMGSPDGQFALRLDQTERRTKDLKDANRYRQIVALPIAVTGADPRDLRVDSSEITFKTLSGITRHSRARVNLVEQKLVHTMSLDRTFFDAAKDSPVNVRAELYLTQFGSALHQRSFGRDSGISFRAGPVRSRGRLRPANVRLQVGVRGPQTVPFRPHDPRTSLQPLGGFLFAFSFLAAPKPGDLRGV